MPQILNHRNAQADQGQVLPILAVLVAIFEGPVQVDHVYLLQKYSKVTTVAHKMDTNILNGCVIFRYSIKKLCEKIAPGKA
jgi:hypothetical protein